MKTECLSSPETVHPARSTIARVGGLCLALASLPAVLAGPDSGAITNFGVTAEQRFFLEWPGVPEALYRVQSRDRLSPDVAWKTEDVVRAQAGPVRWMAPESLRERKYYRLELPRPDIFRVEPARFPAGVATDFYLIGQCFSSNDVVRFAGVEQSEVLFISPTLLRVSVVPQTVGTYVVELVVHDGFQLSSFPVTAYDPDAPSPSVFQKPPRPHFKSLIDRAPPVLISASVQLHSGEVQVNTVDLVIPGRGLNLVFGRTYRSRGGPVAIGEDRWDGYYNIRIQPGPNGPDGFPAQLTVFGGDGREDVFQRQPNGTYTHDEFFAEGALVTGVFRLTFSDGAFWEFNPLDGPLTGGKISRIQDRNDNTLHFEYDGDGRLDLIVDTLDRTNRLFYNAEGRLASFVDFSGRAIIYEYYADGEDGGSPGDLKSITGPPVVGTPHRNDFPAGKTTTFTYTKDFPDARQNHLLLSITDPKGQTSRAYNYQHNESDLQFLRCISEQRGLPGHVIQYHYAPQTPSPDNGFAVMKTIVNDRSGNVSEHSYDSLNRLVNRREFTGRALPDQPATETANRPVNPLRTSDPVFFETHFEWNNDSLCTRIVYPGGNSEEFLYERDFDPAAPPRMKGNLRVHRHFSATDLDGDGRLDVLATYLEHDPRFGAGVRFDVADLKGLLAEAFWTRMIDPRGHETRCTYDHAGNRTEVRHATPSIDTTEYYEGGTLIARKWPANGGVEVPGQEQRRDEFTYYEEGPQRGYLHQQIVDAGPGRLNLTTTYEYDAVGNPTRIVDPRGNDTLHTYNALNQVVSSQSPLVSPDVPVRYTTLYFYDANDNLVRRSVENRDDTGAPGVDSFFDVFYEVDLLDRVTAITRQVDEANSITTQFTYDANGNLSRLLKPEAVNGNDPLNIVQYQYDERDLLFRRTRAPGSALQSTDGFDYDANGNLFQKMSGMDSETEVIEFTYHYDGFSRLVGSTDAMGNGPTCELDSNGNIVSVRFFGETNDVPGSAGNRLLSETRFGHDPLNRPAFRMDSFFDIATGLPIGDGARTTQFEYTDSSHLRSVTDDRGNVTRYAYDSAHRVRRTTDARGNTVTCAYDPNGNVISLSETNKSDVVPQDQVFVTEYQYDNLDRLSRTTDNVGNTTQYGYDSRGNRVSMIDPRGTPARYEYDGLSRVISFSQDVDGNGGLDRLRTYVWDDNSRLRASTHPNDNVTQYAYDSLDRLVRTTFADQTAHTNSYDARDNLTVSRDANNTLVTTQYDLLNRVTNKTILPGSGVANTTTFERYQYDGLSRLVRAENDSATHTFVWNSLAGPSSETVNGRTVAYTYDALGNRLSVAYPGGQMVTYSYDSLNRVSGVGSIPFAGGALATVVSNHYVGPNRIARRDLGNSLRTRVHYNGEVGTPNAQGDFGRGQVSRIRHAAPGAAPIIDERAFAYDANQNKTARWLTTPFGPGGQTNQQTFGYDRLHRLTRATVTLGADLLRDTHYELDLAGNRLQVIDGLCSGPYTMDAAPPPGPADFQMNQYTTTGCDAREYDENGNLRATENGGKVIVRGWDYRNRLVSITDPDSGVIAEYAYDALGRRIRKTIAPGSPARQATEYVFAGANVIEERDDFDAVRMAITLDGDPLKEESHMVLMTQNGQDFYYHTDDLGNVLALTDAVGNVVERYEYDDYGAPMFLDPAGNPLQGATESVVGNPYLFHGHRWDSEAALYHCKRSGDPIMEWTFDKGWPGRYEASRLTTAFDPAAGRYIMRAGVPLAGNQYTYAGGNPWSARSGPSLSEADLEWAATEIAMRIKADLIDQILKNHLFIFDDKDGSETVEIWDRSRQCGGGGSQFNGPPHILFAIPSSGGSFMPIVITGSRFENPTIPFINGVPSGSLFYARSGIRKFNPHQGDYSPAANFKIEIDGLMGGGGGGVQFMNKAELVEQILKNKKAGFESKAAAERAFDAVIDSSRPADAVAGTRPGGVQYMNKAQLVDLILKDKKAGFDSKNATERAFDSVIDAIREGVQKD